MNDPIDWRNTVRLTDWMTLDVRIDELLRKARHHDQHVEMLADPPVIMADRGVE